ncbi:uncharacterized protein LOC125188287 [Salvia hispanica]|uniref:uncharacterized protein LOC125188287 n=1 Tax=Salvia hispanica TaxID=49212 RepID=UPI002009B2EF|nr:uncharacterized protein LOC125188287 [Salvia hispanica]
MKEAQDRQKSYADVRRTDLQFQADDKVSPSKWITRFGVKGKLKLRFIGPYEILEEVGLVAYRLALPPSLGNVHNVFHVSQLQKYVFDPKHVIHYEEVALNPNLSYEERPQRSWTVRGSNLEEQIYYLYENTVEKSRARRSHVGA